MKKVLLLFLGILSFTSIKANDINTITKKATIANRFDNAITFVERGVKFHVFLNGDFEFDTPYNNRRYFDYNGNRIRRNTLRIDRDYEGRIKRVGNNYIRYDYRGNVTRIGKIRLYYRRGALRKVGNLRISYNSWGEPYFTGNVNNYDYYNDDVRFSINIGPIFNYNDRYFYKRDFRNNYRKFKEDRNFYYYRAKPNAKTGKRGKVIKRRKAGVTTRNNNSTNNRRKVTPKKRIKSTKKVYKRKVDKDNDRRRRS